MNPTDKLKESTRQHFLKGLEKTRKKRIANALNQEYPKYLEWKLEMWNNISKQLSQ